MLYDTLSDYNKSTFIACLKLDIKTPIQQKRCIMIPDFVQIAGAPWATLPPGIHTANIHEIRSRFVLNAHRLHLFQGFLRGLSALHAAGCKKVYLDGSFITAKPLPDDYDACWEENGVDLLKIDPVLLDFSNERKAQKAKYYGEYFPANTPADAKGRTYKDFFQLEKHTGQKKGILEINLT